MERFLDMYGDFYEKRPSTPHATKIAWGVLGFLLSYFTWISFSTSSIAYSGRFTSQVSLR